MLKGFVLGEEKDIKRIPMFVDGVEKNSWEVRDNQDRLIWGREDELQTATGTLPFKGYALPVKVKSLLGNAVQNGTPAPDNIITPEMCGVLNENLAIIDSDSRTITNGYYYDVRLTNVIPAGTYKLSFSVDSKTGTPYSGSIGRGTTSGYIADVAYMYIGADIPVTVKKTFTLTESACVWARFLRASSPSTFSYSISKIRVEEGSTAYGWKVPFENHGENLCGAEIEQGTFNPPNGKEDTSKKRVRTKFDNKPLQSGTYTISCVGSTGGVVLYCYDTADISSYDSASSQTSWTPLPFTFTLSAAKFVRFAFCKSNVGDIVPSEISNLMLNSGSTAKPYSPYLNATLPVYLGEVPTVRRVRKLVLTSTTAEWTYDSTYNRYTFRIADSLIVGVRLTPVACSHFVPISDGRSIGDVPNNAIYSNAQQTINNWFIKTTDYTTTASFKQFLDDELAAGHPVTVWYVLANEETAIVNEPLAKISTYADELTTIQVHGLSAPLYGIGDYKDTLNLATGVVTRKVKKLVLTGEENWALWSSGQPDVERYYYKWGKYTPSLDLICTHLPFNNGDGNYDHIRLGGSNREDFVIYISKTIAPTVADFKAYLTDQYQAGTPVTAWYVLSTPTTETITVPTGMTGEIEGYLTQISTPTPTHQSIPKWNGKEETGGTYAVTVYDLPEIETTTGQNTFTVDTTIAPYNVTINGHVKYTYWGKIREDVRSGLAQTKFPVGTILYDNNDETTGRAFQVVGYDKHFDPSLTARGFTHSMTLCQLKLSGPWQYDAIEAFLYTTVEMQPGTYKFKIPNYDTAYGGNKTYYFTSTASVPVDSQITLSWAYQQPPKTVTAYAGPNPQTNTTAITGFNALPLSEWIEGESPEAIDLGTIKLANNDPDSAYGKLNHIHRARYGSNNYYQSGLRQLLNTDLASNNWWHPTTIFDRPYANRTTNGYLRSLNEDFINVLATPEITHIANNIFEYPSLDGRTFTLNTEYKINTDKVFLLSHTEVGLSSSPNVGTVLDYYSTHNTNSDRIKYRIDNGNAYYWWLRTPYPSSANFFRLCLTSGALDRNGAHSSRGVAPAHIIQ